MVAAPNILLTEGNEYSRNIPIQLFINAGLLDHRFASISGDEMMGKGQHRLEAADAARTLNTTKKCEAAFAVRIYLPG